MHQASQRHNDESAVIKKVQSEAAKEIESVKSRETQEKKILETQLRNLEIESAFQQDMEISIQRAAQIMAENIGSTRNQGSAGSITSSTQIHMTDPMVYNNVTSFPGDNITGGDGKFTSSPHSLRETTSDDPTLTSLSQSPDRKRELTSGWYLKRKKR